MRIAFQTEETPRPNGDAPLRLPIPALGNLTVETIAPDPGKTERVGSVSLQRVGGLAVVHLSRPLSSTEISETTRSIYHELFSALDGFHLYRLWNYVPHINRGEGDREVYRQFCLGRSQAYEANYGDRSEQRMAAGTCVGCDGRHIAVIAVAGSAIPEHHENPHQTPAYQYPREYGPRSPSFARASTATFDDTRLRYISGTAAVVGHQSKGGDNFDEQFRITADNIDTVVAATLATAPGSPATTEASGKVYLRHAESYPRARECIESRFPDWSKNVIYLRSDLCRKELLLEVEFSFIDRY